jgi:peptide/nickel transport system permease protein
MVVALAGISVPSFWLGLGLILVFAIGLGWLPSGGYVPMLEDPIGALKYLLLPAFSLGFMQAAWLARTVRASVLDVMAEDYVRTAHAKGLRRFVVIVRHVLRNAMPPTITVVGLSFAIMLGGSIITETVFNVPGLGRLIISSVLRRDYPVIQGGILFIAVAYLAINLAVDLACGFFDPRIVYK